MSGDSDAPSPIRSALRGFFITGTDTEVGKTTVSTGILHALGQQGVRCAGYKPVAAGADWLADARLPGGGRWCNDDVDRLCAASPVDVKPEDVCTGLFRDPCAPHIAAALEGQTISPQVLIDGALRLMTRCDAVIVEGVGGFLVPLVDGWAGPRATRDAAAVASLVASSDVHPAAADSRFAWGADDLAAALGLPVILVVGLRLGCINHALLTAQAVTARGLRLVGWIGNRIDPAMRHPEQNIDLLTRWLAERFGAPRLGLVAHMSPATASGAAAGLEASALRRLLTSPAS
jgi:dethiobiotin synthetase